MYDLKPPVNIDFNGFVELRERKKSSQIIVIIVVIGRDVNGNFCCVNTVNRPVHSFVVIDMKPLGKMHFVCLLK
jgi:hypothetical protein